jgi:creatinine amidohydrolase
VPTGAIEQHGPHLPLDTDTFLCTSVATAAAERACGGGPVLVTPAVSFGSSEHHMAFAGTVTLRTETFRQAVAEICASLARHGFRRLLVVNGHGGNTALLAAAIQQLGFEAPVHAVTVDYWTLARDVIADVRDSGPGGMGHACEFETSLMLHLRPESVRRDRIVREIVAPRHSHEQFDLFEKSGLSAHWKTHELSHSGVMGAPDLATEEKGRRLFDACVEGLAALIEELRSVQLPSV